MDQLIFIEKQELIDLPDKEKPHQRLVLASLCKDQHRPDEAREFTVANNPDVTSVSSIIIRFGYSS